MQPETPARALPLVRLRVFKEAKVNFRGSDSGASERKPEEAKRTRRPQGAIRRL